MIDHLHAHANAGRVFLPAGRVENPTSIPYSVCVHQHLCILLVLLLCAGCRQQMADQPHYRPLQENDFFPDGRASRPLELGTIARGQLREDTHLYTGKRGGPGEVTRFAAIVGGGTVPLTALVPLAARPNPLANYHDTFPFPVTKEVLQRGQERFHIFCAVCHDRIGTGNGIIVQRGFTQPPSFQTDHSRGLAFQGVNVSLRNVPPGYIFDVITHGYGAMPEHAAQIPVRDRWAIAAYIKALQLSQHVPADQLTEEERLKLKGDAAR